MTTYALPALIIYIYDARFLGYSHFKIGYGMVLYSHTLS